MENDLEIRGKVQEIYVMTRENHVMLTKIRRNQKISSILRALYFVFVVGVAAGAYYYVQPYVDKVLWVYNQTTKTGQAVQDFSKQFPEIGNITHFLDQLRGSTTIEKK